MLRRVPAVGLSVALTKSAVEFSHGAATQRMRRAEGARNRNSVRFSNSDPEMVRTFVDFLRSYCDLADELIRLTCHLYADHAERQREIEGFWLQVSGLPEASLRRSIVNVYSKYSARKRMNMLPYGTCRVVVNRTSVVQSIYGAIQEYGGFDREAWVM